MSPHTDRLEILLRIAREYHFSFDDLDDWTCNLDWQEFQDWSKIFPKTNDQRSQYVPARLQEETARPYVELPSDDPDGKENF